MSNVSAIINVNVDDFEQFVLEASQQQPILVDFWADWCSPCLFIAPTLEAVIEEYQGRVRLAKVEVDEGENMKLAGRYQVRGFPTLILFEKGVERARFSSAQSKTFISTFLQENSEFLSA